MLPPYYPFYQQNPNHFCNQSCFNHRPKMQKMVLKPTNVGRETISVLQQPVTDPIDNNIKNVDANIRRFEEVEVAETLTMTLRHPVPIIVKQVTNDAVHNNTQNVDINIGQFAEADDVAAAAIFQQDIDVQQSLIFNEQYWARNIIVPGGAEHLLQVLSVNANDQTVDIKWLTTLTTETLSMTEYEFESIDSISRKRKANHRYL